MAFWMSKHLQNITGGRPPSILYTETKPPRHPTLDVWGLFFAKKWPDLGEILTRELLL